MHLYIYAFIFDLQDSAVKRCTRIPLPSAPCHRLSRSPIKSVPKCNAVEATGEKCCCPGREKKVRSTSNKTISRTISRTSNTTSHSTATLPAHPSSTLDYYMPPVRIEATAITTSIHSTLLPKSHTLRPSTPKSLPSTHTILSTTPTLSPTVKLTTHSSIPTNHSTRHIASSDNISTSRAHVVTPPECAKTLPRSLVGHSKHAHQRIPTPATPATTAKQTHAHQRLRSLSAGPSPRKIRGDTPITTTHHAPIPARNPSLHTGENSSCAIAYNLSPASTI